MKVTKLTLVLISALCASASGAGFSNWNLNDIKQFLTDRKVVIEDGISDADLAKLATTEFEKLKNFDKYKVDVNDKSQQHILNKATDPHASLNDYLPYHNWDYLFKTEEQDSYSKLKNWVFESWSTTKLKSFLKKNKVKFDKKASKQDLIDLIKGKYDDIAASHQVSGNYPGDWLYNDWSVDDLKSWLTSFDLPFDPKETKENLLEKVKLNNYVASVSYDDTKKSLLDSLNLSQESIFDKAGHIKHEFYDTWSYSQLREWLYIQGLIDTKPGVYADDLSLAKLKKLALSHENYLVQDIKSWLSTAEKTADPLLSKGKKAYDNVINDTFLVGIEKWSKDRLRDFLKARDIAFSQFNTRSQLVELVKENKDKVVNSDSVSNSYSWIVDNLSTDSLKEWLHEQGQNIEGSRQDLVATLSGYLSSAKPKKSVEKQIKNYKPTLEEYKKYVKKNVENANSLSEDAIEKTYSIVSKYYDSASDSLHSTYDEAAYSIEDGLDQVQKASYEYSTLFLKDYEKNKENIQEHLESAKIAANDYSKSLGSALVANYQQTKSYIGDVVDDGQSYIWSVFNTLTGLFYQHKPKVEDAASAGARYAQQVSDSAQKSAKDSYEAVKQAGEAAQPHVEAAVKEAYKNAKEAGEAAQPHVEAAAKKVYKNAKEAGEAAQPHVEAAAKGAYKNAKEAGEAAQPHVEAAAKSAYNNVKPAVEEAVSNGWNYLIDTYTNTDLKSYLQSYGFGYEWLSELNRKQLVRLANEQSNLFFGGSKNKWDSSIVDVLKDTSDRLQKAVHLKKVEPTLWDRIRLLF